MFNKYDDNGFYTSINEFIKQGVEDVKLIFSPSKEELNSFKKIWTEIVLSEIARGVKYAIIKEQPVYLYASGCGYPTKNMATALKMSGISPSGRLPEDYCLGLRAIPTSKDLQFAAATQLARMEKSIDPEEHVGKVR